MEVVDEVRFQKDLEFLECLANPLYLQVLAPRLQQDTALVHYLTYLHRVFTQPKYVLAVRFPFSLVILHHLQDAGFRKELREPGFVRYITEQASFHWQHCPIKTSHLSPKESPP
jgi:mediator of RNA polymerase II transcription subunit 31